MRQQQVHPAGPAAVRVGGHRRIVPGLARRLFPAATRRLSFTSCDRSPLVEVPPPQRAPAESAKESMAPPAESRGTAARARPRGWGAARDGQGCGTWSSS